MGNSARAALFVDALPCASWLRLCLGFEVAYSVAVTTSNYENQITPAVGPHIARKRP